MADMIFSHDGSNASHRDIETHRLRQLWREEAKLHFADHAMLSSKCEREDGGLRRMRFEVEVKQLDPELLKVCRQCRPDGARMQCSAFERQGDGYRGECKDARGARRIS